MLKQIARFATVGAGSTAIHVMVALAFNGYAGYSPMLSNFLAFCVATGWSLGFNWYWTFGRQSVFIEAAPRFLALAMVCFLFNQSIVFVVTHLAGLPLWLAMVPVALLVPAFSFWMSRTQVFINARNPG